MCMWHTFKYKKATQGNCEPCTHRRAREGIEKRHLSKYCPFSFLPLSCSLRVSSCPLRLSFLSAALCGLCCSPRATASLLAADSSSTFVSHLQFASLETSALRPLVFLGAVYAPSLFLALSLALSCSAGVPVVWHLDRYLLRSYIIDWKVRVQ